MIAVLPIAGLPEIQPGEDLARLLSDAAEFGRGDVLVVTQKIVSKALGLFVDLETVFPSAEAMRLAARTQKDPRLVELVLIESTHIVRAAPGVLIARHHCGCVMANAGVDASNLGTGKRDQVLLLPRDPDACAAGLRTAFGADAPAVVLSDSFGRPWRNGVTNFAVGAAGLPALVDLRSSVDRDGRPLRVTQIALADQIASAAGLVMGEAGEGIPAAIVKGLRWDAPEAPAAALIRPLVEDLFQ